MGQNRGNVNIVVSVLGHRLGESDSQWTFSLHPDN
jgi:hypothetical protein